MRTVYIYIRCRLYKLVCHSRLGIFFDRERYALWVGIQCQKNKHYFFEKNVSTTKKKENLLTNFKCDEYLVPIFLDLSVHLSVHFLRDFHFGT